MRSGSRWAATYWSHQRVRWVPRQPRLRGSPDLFCLTDATSKVALDVAAGGGDWAAAPPVSAAAAQTIERRRIPARTRHAAVCCTLRIWSQLWGAVRSWPLSGLDDKVGDGSAFGQRKGRGEASRR